MKEVLLRAYLATTYRVFLSDEAVDIRIGRKHRRLDELLEGRPWAFISACNPGSVLKEDNAARHRALLDRLDGYALHQGVGIPDGEDWPPEQSVLVSGIMERDAVSIGREFGQNAIVCGEKGQVARLVWIS